MSNPPGPMCTSNAGASWIDGGTMTRTRMWPPSGAPRCTVGGWVALQYEVKTNAFGDKLPVIPAGARLKHGKVLYRLDLNVKLLSLPDRLPLKDLAVPALLWKVKYPVFKTNHKDDKITLLTHKTGPDGAFSLRIETRETGELKLMETSGITDGAGFQISLKEAWYEDTFLITGYNVCEESDFSGPLVSANGLGTKHKEDFLFSATGVVMEGTGLATGGQYIQFVSMTTTWHRNAHGNRDHIADQSKVTFKTANGVQGAYGPVTQGTSIAVDPTVIPKHAWVSIDTVGERRADDTGSAIVGAHIDNFLGAGKAVADAWDNIDAAKVRYLGPRE